MSPVRWTVQTVRKAPTTSAEITYKKPWMSISEVFSEANAPMAVRLSEMVAEVVPVASSMAWGSTVVPSSAAATSTEASELSEPLVDAASSSEEHTSELQSRGHLVSRLLLEKKKNS